MARGNAVWGIDIGQSALKALRCSLDSDGKTVRAEAFDFIEYPQILTQPDADPEALVRDALKEFLSRNSVRGTKVAISVSGQSGLARFIKLPPVEAKKIPDIVKYEAKQQIPFDLEDVIWSYQALPGSAKAEAFQETEVGLFAMKREHVFRAIRPLDDAGVELDIVQLTPICIYNAVTYGVLTDVPSPADYDPDTPLPWVVVLSMGTETTDLVVTNGFRIWNRSIPLGGNHFTKQLTKEMKLTFATAEQLKRNSRDADNAKEVFQAMRSVFNDLVTEVQRSIAFFRTIERNANISRIVALGNTIKLPGLQQYLAKNLGVPVDRVNTYEHLEGAEVTAAPAFEDNVPAFAVCYGLVLQGLGLGKMATNLVPRELVVARMIRRKKPWALAAVATTLAALTFNYMFHWSRLAGADPSLYSSQNGMAQAAIKESEDFKKADAEQQDRLKMLKSLGHEVVGNAEGRVLMLELLKVINDALPREEGADPMAVSSIPIESQVRPFIHIEHIEMQYKKDAELKEWFDEEAEKRYLDGLADDSSDGPAAAADGSAPDAAAAEGATPADPNAPPASDVATATPESPSAANAPSATDATAGGGATDAKVDSSVLEGKNGWIVELKCKHYHNDIKQRTNLGKQYVRNTLLKSLRGNRKLKLPVPGDPNQPVQEFTIEQLGIYFPLIASDEGPTQKKIPNPNYVPPVEEFMETTENRNPLGIPITPKPKKDNKPEDKSNRPEFSVYTYTFTIQFAWIPRRFSERNVPLEPTNAASPDPSQTAGG